MLKRTMTGLQGHTWTHLVLFSRPIWSLADHITTTNTCAGIMIAVSQPDQQTGLEPTLQPDV